MRIMTTTKVPVYVSLAVAGIMALSACGSNSSNNASNSSPIVFIINSLQDG